MGMRQLGAILFAAAVAQSAGAFIAPASAAPCPGNPDAIGTSRVLVVHPGEFSQLGTLQYHQTLPLGDKEVVLTFDDGPLPPATNQVLDTLASQCVKATFFLVGEMAHYFPTTVRRIYDEGHTIGTHSEDHPTRFDRLSNDKLQWEIDDGIASVSAALGDPDKVAPFFRIPGLGRTAQVEDALTARSLITFSVDAVADDWRHIKPDEIVARAMRRLERRGGGILLLHDIHKATAAALPNLLKELKEHGFKIVQVVYDNSPLVATAGAAEPEARLKAEHTKWMVAIATSGQLILDDMTGHPTWPEIDEAGPSDLIGLPVPDAEAFEPDYPAALRGQLPAEEAAETRWPEDAAPTPAVAISNLPDASVQKVAVPQKPQSESDSPALRPGLEGSGRTERERRRHERIRSRRHTATRPDSGHHADLSGGFGFPALATLLTPVH